MFCPKCGDRVEENERFCNKCGHLLQYVSNTSFNNKNKKKNNTFMVVVGASVGIVVVFLIFIFVSSSKNSITYISNEQIVDVGGNDNPPQKKGKYSTIIVADNVYENVPIKTQKDINELIVKDSTSQKKYCPKEILQIEDEMIKKFNITAVNLCELDVEFARELINLLDYIYKEFPNIRENLTNFTLQNAGVNADYLAAFQATFPFASSNSSSGYPIAFKTQIYLNTAYFLNQERLEASMEASSKSGHMPPNGTIYSPVAHEWGHYVSFITTLKYYNDDSILLVNMNDLEKFKLIVEDWNEGKHSLNLIKEAYNRYKNDTNDNIAFDEWRGTISNYAVAKNDNGEYIYDETIAEAFHDVYLNRENATAASKYIIEVLKERVSR